MSDFSYLKSYIDNEIEERNCFHSLTIEEIEKSEKRLKLPFPSQLKEFYLTIGFGAFANNHDRSVIDMNYANRLIDPESVADIKLLGYDSGQVMPDVEFEEGEIPFFEIDQGAHFFVMRPNSNTPNAVYEDGTGKLIEEFFEKFIWRLYYESPVYYMKDW